MLTTRDELAHLADWISEEERELWAAAMQTCIDARNLRLAGNPPGRIRPGMHDASVALSKVRAYYIG